MGVFDATLQGDCGCNRVAPESSPPVNTSWLDARQLDYATRGGRVRPQFGGGPGSANVIVPSVPLNLIPPTLIDNELRVPSDSCVRTLMPLICLWAPAIRRLHAAQFQLSWISQIIAQSRGNHYRALLHIAEFGTTLDETLNQVRPLDPRSWQEGMPELYGQGPGVLGNMLDLAVNLSYTIEFLRHFNQQWDPSVAGRPDFRRASDDSATFYKRLFLVFGLSQTLLAQFYFQRHYSELLAAYQSAVLTPGCRPFADQWLRLNGPNTIGVRGGVRFVNPLWFGSQNLGIGTDLDSRSVNPELYTQLVHIGFRASEDEIDALFSGYDSDDIRMPALNPLVTACGGGTK